MRSVTGLGLLKLAARSCARVRWWLWGTCWAAHHETKDHDRTRLLWLLSPPLPLLVLQCDRSVETQHTHTVPPQWVGHRRAE